MSAIGRREWRYLFHYVDGQTTTSYLLPFFGNAAVAVARRHIVVAPLDSAHVTILRADGRLTRIVAIPVTRLPFDRRLISSLRDSLLARTSGPPARRIRDLYSDKLATPARTPALRTIRTIGNKVWVETSTTDRAGRRQWFLVGPAEGRIVGRIWLPGSWTLLTGDQQRILILQKDELGVESIAIYRVSPQTQSR